MEADFKQYLAQTTDAPLIIDVASAEGSYIYDKDGKAYIDFIAGLAVTNVGHRNPAVLAAIKDQLERYLHVIPYGEFLQDPQIELAKYLAQKLPSPLERSYFVNSGAEAVEGALKLAKRHTGRTEIIACHRSYHGSTHGALSVSGNETKRTAFEPLLPEVSFLAFNNEEDLTHISETTAAVIIETIQGDAAVRIPSRSYLQALRKRCDETGTLLIFDEIQAGIGRTGKLFAFEHFGVVPDILCLAKALAGGMPMGCFVASSEVMLDLSHNPMLGHITTFGGHPISCAAALATLKFIDENLLKGVAVKGALIKEKLKHPLILEVRQIGLMIAVDLPSAELTDFVVRTALERGLIIFRFLSSPNSFRISPPLTIAPETIEKACQILLEVLDEV